MSDSEYEPPVCTSCERLLGLEHGYAAMDDKCAPCSGKRAMKCQRCQVVFADVGSGGCPFCSFRLVREL